MLKSYLDDIEKEKLIAGKKRLDRLKEKETLLAFCTQRLYIQTHTDKYRKMTEVALTKLEELDKAQGITHGLNSRTGHHYNIDIFALEMRSRMTNRAQVIAEDDKILEQMHRAINVENN